MNTLIDLRMEFVREHGIGTDHLNHSFWDNSMYVRWLENRALKEMRTRHLTDQFTCSKCDSDTNNCEFAFDSYNTDGDCLAIK